MALSEQALNVCSKGVWMFNVFFFRWFWTVQHCNLYCTFSVAPRTQSKRKLVGQFPTSQQGIEHKYRSVCTLYFSSQKLNYWSTPLKIYFPVDGDRCRSAASSHHHPASSRVSHTKGGSMGHYQRHFRGLCRADSVEHQCTLYYIQLILKDSLCYRAQNTLGFTLCHSAIIRLLWAELWFMKTHFSFDFHLLHYCISSGFP